jgi:hypothetical protein
MAIKNKIIDFSEKEKRRRSKSMEWAETIRT